MKPCPNRNSRISLSIYLAVFCCFLLIRAPIFANASCIDINRAPIEELIKIRHIGEVRAEEIIELRREKEFSSIDELIRVYGIGPARISDIKEQNLACVQPEQKLQPISPSLKTQDKNTSEKTEDSKPDIVLSYPEKNPVDKEIEITFSVSGLKEAAYDLKISIEKEGPVSDIYNENENKWQSSHYYINNLFYGNSFKGIFRLKIKEKEFGLQGQTDILVRLREKGRSDYLEHKDKINITEPEHVLTPPLAEGPASGNRQHLLASQAGLSYQSFPTAFSLAIFSGIMLLTLKRKISKT